jgi:PAS domain S-box-containing protein
MGQDSKYLGIGKKITVMVFALVVVSSCAVGYFTYVRFWQVLVGRALDELSTLSRVASARWQAGVSNARGDALFLSGVPAVQGIIRARSNGGIDAVDNVTEQQWRDRLGVVFQALLHSKPDYVQARLIGIADGGREILRVDRSGQGGSIRVVPENELQQKGNRRYFQQAIKLPAGKAHLSDVELNRELDHELTTPHQPVVRAAAPVFTPRGEVFGIVIINRNLTPLFAELRHNLQAQQSLYVINDQGDFLLHPDASKAFGFELGQRYRMRDEFPILDRVVFDPDESARPVVEQPSSGEKLALGWNRVYFDPDNADRFIAIALAVPFDTIAAEPIRARNFSILVAAAVLVPAMVIGYGLSRNLANPLQQIVESVSRFSRGDTELYLPVDATDETGVVARALHNMIDQVRSRTVALETEVAERQSAERRSNEQSARINSIVNSVVDAIITIDSNGLIESANSASERMFGYQRDELIGRNVKMLMPEPYRSEHDQYLRNYAQSGVPKIIGIGREVTGVRKDGSEFPVDLAVSQVQLGDRHMFTGVVRDISDRKRSESDLIRANEELARRAASIERFNKQLARSNDELKQFAYVASHDLQEPLRKVTSFCEMLRDEYRDRLDGEALTYIDYAVSGALRMKALVTDLLEYSRVETQGKPLEPTSADKALALAIDNLELTIAEAGATVEVSPLPVVAADNAQLTRLFQNLIGNAIKYRGDAPPRVDVWAEEENGEWVFHVQDNGLGIDPQYHSRIFVIFQRLHSREAYAGTGIGLAVCKRIVERFGGRIWVESALGKGSDFCFALPTVASDVINQIAEGQENGHHYKEELARQSH